MSIWGRKRLRIHRYPQDPYASTAHLRHVKTNMQPGWQGYRFAVTPSRQCRCAPIVTMLSNPVSAVMFIKLCLREVESTLTLLNGHIQSLSQNLHAAVVRHLQVVDTRHDAREIVIGRIRGFTRFADHREHRGEALEAWLQVSKWGTQMQYGNTDLRWGVWDYQ